MHIAQWEEKKSLPCRGGVGTLAKSQPPSVLQAAPYLGPGLPVHLEAVLDCEGGGAAEIFQRGLPRGRKHQGNLPSREFPGSQWIYKWVKWTCAKKRLRFLPHHPFP